MSRGGRSLVWLLLAVIGFALALAVATALKLRADRVPQSACLASKSEAEPPAVAAEFTENLAVTGLSEADLAARGIARQALGELDIETGCIVAADPLVDPARQAFSRVVGPGLYPVTLYRAKDRIALAELRFALGQPRRWVPALLPGQDPRALKADEVYGYPVDAGLGSFMDVAGQAVLLTKVRRTQSRLGPRYSDAYSDVLREPLDRAGGAALLYEPLEDDTGNVAIFQSGWGDGVYPSFWGLDALGQPVLLVTDFGVLEKGDGRERDEASDPADPPNPP